MGFDRDMASASGIVTGPVLPLGGMSGKRGRRLMLMPSSARRLPLTRNRRVGGKVDVRLARISYPLSGFPEPAARLLLRADMLRRVGVGGFVFTAEQLAWARSPV